MKHYDAANPSPFERLAEGLLILAGHGLAMAHVKLGLEDVPVLSAESTVIVRHNERHALDRTEEQRLRDLGWVERSDGWHWDGWKFA